MSGKKGRSGAPKGNQNARRAKDWRDALHKALVRYERGDVEKGQALYRIAVKCVADALEGDDAARREIATRLDGKPVERHEHNVYQTIVTEALRETDERITRLFGTGEDRHHAETKPH